MIISTAMVALVGGLAVPGVRPNPVFEWNTKPWEIRYIVFIERLPNFRIKAEQGARSNASRRADHAGRKSLDGDVFLRPQSTFAVPAMEPVGVAPMVFNQDGHVTAPETLRGYLGKRTGIDLIALVPERAPRLQYTVALWSQGVPGDIYFSPAVCDIWDLNHRYGSSWVHGLVGLGDVGCREWTAQLYQRERPYIDITTYTDDGNFIGSLVGWSRFRDPPKPVIGQHGATWLCLYECPAGERPGVIPDIRAWTAKHGFPLPHRPKEQPEFPNRNYRDDFNE